MALLSRLFSVCPRVRKSEGKLVAVTAWLPRILTLGCLYRTIVVDPKSKELAIYRRYFWVFARHRCIRFGEVEAVAYGYKDWAIGSSLTWAHDSADLYSVGLRLRGGDKLHLFYFYGDGTFSHDGVWPDWLYWEDYLVDMSGTQQRESRTFVELLCKMIGVSVVPARY